MSEIDDIKRRAGITEEDALGSDPHKEAMEDAMDLLMLYSSWIGLLSDRDKQRFAQDMQSRGYTHQEVLDNLAKAIRGEV